MGSILLGSRAGWGVGGADALGVLGLDEGERVETARLDIGRGLAAQAAPAARGIAETVERHGVADEAILKEDARAGRIVAGIEAQLHLATDELGADLQEAAAGADGAVPAYHPARAGPRGPP